MYIHFHSFKFMSINRFCYENIQMLELIGLKIEGSNFNKTIVTFKDKFTVYKECSIKSKRTIHNPLKRNKMKKSPSQ